MSSAWDSVSENVNVDEDVKPPEYPRLPDGTYEFVVSEFARHTTKKGDPKFKVELTTIHGDKEMTIRDFLEPRRFEMNADGSPVTDKDGKPADMPFYWRTLQFLKACGGSGQISLVPDENGRYTSIIGSSLKATVKTKQSGEYTNTNVSKYESLVLQEA